MSIFRHLKYYLVRLFRMKKGNHQIALGFVMGFFPCWFPTFGVGPALSVAIARLVNANVPAAVIAASLGSFAWPVLFFLNYKAGKLLYFSKEERETVVDVAFEDITYIEGIEITAAPEPDPASVLEYIWSFINSVIAKFGMHFMVGSLFNSIFFTVAGYFLAMYVFARYRAAILRRLTRTK